jgi:uncharacterized protein YdeI (YjbR/CyaY-like superfamily)
MKKIPHVYAKNSKEWRNWLKRNHRKENKVRLILYKKHTNKPSIGKVKAMKDAICFGWIDTTMNRMDDERYIQTFVKRKKNANWSRNTLSYAKKLIKEKKMTPEGLKAYKLGLKKMPHDKDLPKNPRTPRDLMEALKKNKKAKENWNNFALSYKKAYIYWIIRAKRKETREKRIKEVVKRSKLNKKLGD